MGAKLMDKVQKGVQRSNMTKDGGGNDSGGKTLKGPNFELPNIKKCLEKQGWKKRKVNRSKK